MDKPIFILILLYKLKFFLSQTRLLSIHTVSFFAIFCFSPICRNITAIFRKNTF